METAPNVRRIPYAHTEMEEELYLDFQLLDDGLGIYDSEGQRLQSSEEKVEHAETEIARLQAELARLKEQM